MTTTAKPVDWETVAHQSSTVTFDIANALEAIEPQVNGTEPPKEHQVESVLRVCIASLRRAYDAVDRAHIDGPFEG